MPDEPRPIGVTLTTLLIAACLVAELVEIKARLLVPHAIPMLWGSLTYLLVPKAVAVIVLYFYWRGRDWALWMVLAEVFLTITNQDLLMRTNGP